jgi:acetolactate synthase-1/2/3 large subunit
MGSNKISGAEAVIRCLLEEGVDLLYGYPGGAIMPVYDELYKFKDQLHHVLVRRARGNACCSRLCESNRKVGVAIATSALVRQTW